MSLKAEVPVYTVRRMDYISTRGLSPGAGFSDAVMTGMGQDGGLLLPASIPEVGDRLNAWQNLSYVDLASDLMSLYTDIPSADLRRLVDESCATFRDPEVTPVKRVGDVWILELFHGPTLAFKDVALQFLGRLFEHLLKERGELLNIVAATSGDTGSAAIHGVRGRPGMRIFVMHPQGRVSALQERQMTSVLDSNVFNVAVRGTFDDCQRILKTLLGDPAYRKQHSLGAVNSINWARVLAQMVYYFYSGLRVMKQTGAKTVSFAVPTGNFGDILSGYFAARMGLPVSRLVLATNENDILDRFLTTGIYSLGQVSATLSPSMDIQVASNFERYLYYLVRRDSGLLRSLMDAFERRGSMELPGGYGEPGGGIFVSGSARRDETLRTIKRFMEQHDYLLDPHTAVGVAVGERHVGAEPMICLATAHPAKFPDAIREAVGRDLAHHPILDGLSGLPTRCDTLPADANAVREYVAARTECP